MRTYWLRHTQNSHSIPKTHFMKIAYVAINQPIGQSLRQRFSHLYWCSNALSFINLHPDLAKAALQSQHQLTRSLSLAHIASTKLYLNIYFSPKLESPTTNKSLASVKFEGCWESPCSFSSWKTGQWNGKCAPFSVLLQLWNSDRSCGSDSDTSTPRSTLIKLLYLSLGSGLITERGDEKCGLKWGQWYKWAFMSYSVETIVTSITSGQSGQNNTTCIKESWLTYIKR